MSSQYGELWPTSGWDRFGCLGHPCKFQRVSRLGFVTAWHSSSGRQPHFAALNRGRQLYSAGRPSRWALAHTLVVFGLAWSCSVIVVFPCCRRWRNNLMSLSIPFHVWVAAEQKGSLGWGLWIASLPSLDESITLQSPPLTLNSKQPTCICLMHAHHCSLS